MTKTTQETDKHHPGISRRLKWIVCAGARPNFMKIAPLLRQIKKHADKIQPLLVHTGQHYSAAMSDQFFNQLAIDPPDVNLGVGSLSHARQTARIMEGFEAVLEEHKPDLVIVVGDVNSTLACALTAVKMNIKVAHVEAGLRSFDNGMPEEINRKLTDTISDYLFITEPSALVNLENEGVPKEKIFYVGNTMIDSLLTNRDLCMQSDIVQRFGLKEKEYALLTLHRPSNVDKKEDLISICTALKEISGILPIVFPAHPRTLRQIESFNIPVDYLTVVPPLGYHDFLKLMSSSTCVLTDSGGIQEESTVLGVPCLTLRRNTERPVTVQLGTNKIVGTDPVDILAAFKVVYNLRERPLKLVPIKFWDGKAAQRIISVLTTR